MNREDIIRMAREAGFESSEYGLNCTPGMYAYNMEIVERFAALVAAHIRETEFKPDWNNYRQGFADGVAEEREACAKVCENQPSPLLEPLTMYTGSEAAKVVLNSRKYLAAAIRARGETK